MPFDPHEFVRATCERARRMALDAQWFKLLGDHRGEPRLRRWTTISRNVVVHAIELEEMIAEKESHHG